MKIRLISFITAIVLCLVGTVKAETLTLNDCLKRAKTNNPTLKTSAWDSRIAEENVRLVSSSQYPRIDAQAGYTMQHMPQAVVIAGNIAETQEAQYATANVSANYTIYDFGRREARKQQAISTAGLTSNLLKARQSDTFLQVIEAYYGILESEKLINNAQDEVTQIEQHRKIAQALFEEGVVTRNDVLQANVRLAAARQKLISINNLHNNSWLQLNYLTGAEETFRATLDDKAVIEDSESSNQNEADTFNRRNEILALRQGIEASESEVKETSNGFMPELYTRLGMDYVQNEKAREQTIYSAFIGIKLNVFDGFSTTATKEKAIRNRYRSLDLLHQTESQIRLEIATTKNNVRVAAEKISVSEAAIRQSEENLRINSERYKERVGTATEVLDAQTLLTQTKTDYFSALYEHQISLARLKRAVGRL